ncbi:hypothetical protein [Peredibacter starrii]|uniref:DUF304 domain-containing protein n=1 Tax=Peredibacter starrii TaxID=28202 RepID=A0AAX4HPJ2_9BACT|nr:hypothetical protein [Peredibacter starrii]WPU65041.1 hypothetical protein SOO65_20300 [Peredibacter starrii]
MKFVSYLEILAGAAIVYFIQNKVTHMLGYLLIFIGLSYVIWNEEISFDLDEKNSLIHWNKKKFLRQSNKTIPYSDIKRIFVQRVGKASSFTEFFCVSMELQSGEVISSPERFSTEAEAYANANQLKNLLLPHSGI